MFSGNQPLTASETDNPAEGGTQTVIYKRKSKKGDKHEHRRITCQRREEVSGEEQRFLQAHVAEFSADEQKKFELVVPEVEAGSKA